MLCFNCVTGMHIEALVHYNRIPPDPVKSQLVVTEQMWRFDTAVKFSSSYLQACSAIISAFWWHIASFVRNNIATGWLLKVTKIAKTSGRNAHLIFMHMTAYNNQDLIIKVLLPSHIIIMKHAMGRLHRLLQDTHSEWKQKKKEFNIWWTLKRGGKMLSDFQRLGWDFSG